MKLTLVATILYLERQGLPENEIISLVLFGEEGYELQQAVRRENEGATSLAAHPLLQSSGYKPDYGTRQFTGLMREIERADLAIQFINSFPTRCNEEGDGLNLRVVIMHKETLWKVLRQFQPSEDARSGPIAAPAPVLNGFKGHPAKSRKPRKASLATA